MAEASTRLVAGVAHIALVEQDRVVVLEMPELVARAEIGTSSDSQDVAFVGKDRLAVLVRGGDQSTLYVVDPAGPTKLGEVTFRGATRIAAVAGDHVLAIGAGGAVIVDVSQPEPVATPLPIRGAVTAAGRIDHHAFVIVAGGVVQEWDAAKRAPVRRVRLDRPLDCRFIGGNAKRIWMIPRDEPDHLDLVALATKTTRRLELPEAPAALVPHEAGDLLAMIGADTRSVYLVDVASRRPAKLVDRGPISGLAWIGRDTLVLHGQDRELGLVQIPIERPAEPHDLDPEPGASDRWRPKASVEEWPANEPAPADEPAPPPPPPAPRRAGDDPDRRAARARVSSSAPARTASAEPPAPAPADGPGWRADCGRWARAASAAVPRELPLGMSPIDEACARLELDPSLRPALALLYGAYLTGERVAPLPLARTIGWRWSEALGAGSLAASGAARWHRGAIELADEVLAVLDERPPVRGAIARGEGTAHAVALIVPAELALEHVAEWAAAAAGAGPLLVPREGAALEEVALEARLRGAIPFVRWDRGRGPPPIAALAVADEEIAGELGIPVAAAYRRD